MPAARSHHPELDTDYVHPQLLTIRDAMRDDKVLHLLRGAAIRS